MTKIQYRTAIRFVEDDLRRLRGVLNYYSPKGISIQTSKLIKMLINDEYNRLREAREIDDYLA